MGKQNANIRNKRYFSSSELPLNDDGSVYHLHLLPQHISDTVILVGDPDRVELVSAFFDEVEFRIRNREFVTHTGTYKGKRFTALSTGIGTDNIDIAINELDAAVNIDLNNKCVRDSLRTLNLVRIGTSGSISPDIPVESFVISRYGMGLDNLHQFYRFEFSDEELAIRNDFLAQAAWARDDVAPYVVSCADELLSKLKQGMYEGITLTAPGFYGPQGRKLRIPHRYDMLVETLQKFSSRELSITNFEMETSALYALGRMLGHRCCTCCAIIANRANRTFSNKHNAVVGKLISTVLDRLSD